MDTSNASPLRFIGTGSAFNEALGNNSAYIKRGSTFLLLDCGGTVFHKIQKLSLLKGVQNIFVLITHMHPDHIGSLGDLIFYTYYMLQRKITLIYPDSNSLNALLQHMGVTPDFFNFQHISNQYTIQTTDMNIEIDCVAQKHINTLDSYGYLLAVDTCKLFYSGDSYCIPEQILKDFQTNTINYLYQDTCGYDSPNIPHMSLYKLTQQIDFPMRSRTYCMHLDKSFDIAKAKGLGFNVSVSD